MLLLMHMVGRLLFFSSPNIDYIWGMNAHIHRHRGLYKNRMGI